MDTTAFSRLKATCLERLERVRQTGRALHVAKRGVPMAQILPQRAPEPPRSGFGVMAGTVTETGGILAPLNETGWEVLR
jgi:antitoxin (DNA-binding transcriptional repressor) of toxin-antitoxin stability system